MASISGDGSTVKRYLKVVALVWLLLGLSFGLSREQIESSSAQTSRSPNIIFVRHGKLQPYEEDINFPLIVRGPGIAHGVVRKGLVGNHAIAPTFADTGDTLGPSFVDGRSLLPLAKETSTSWPRTTVLSESNLESPPRWEALRTQSQKYVRFECGEKEYYDLAADPHEVDSDPELAAMATQSYWEQALDDLHGCEGTACRAA